MNVDEILHKHKIVYRNQGADYVVACLNPEHDDSNPSMRIDKITGIFHCFSCGFKGNIFKYYDTPVSHLEVKRNKIKQKIYL
jgi:DNA primase